MSCSNAGFGSSTTTTCHAPTDHTLQLTMSEKTKLMAKKGLLVPCSTPVALVRPMTRAVWEEGMPPEPISLVKSHSRWM